MKKTFFLLFFCLFGLIFSSNTNAAVSNISKIVFTTPEQSIAPGEISKVFTIQTQNSAGQMETIDETADLTLSVDSTSGEFNSNSTNWNPNTIFTMSKNTGNKNFYFKDTSEGEFTITASLKTRTSGASWQTSQKVFVGETIIIDPGTSTTTNSTSTDSGSSSQTSSSTNNISTHYIQEVISVYVEPTIFELSAGRDRLGYVGNPLEFQAKVNLTGSLKHKTCRYFWSFGDGYSDKGDSVNHVYDLPGQYNLLVNGDCDGYKAVDRLRVTVVRPNLNLILSSDSSITINNNSSAEFNLYTTKISNGRDEFKFPLDTIIDAGGQINFPSKLTKLSNYQNIKLIDYSQNILAESNLVAGEKYTESILPEKAIEIIDQLNLLNLIKPID